MREFIIEYDDEKAEEALRLIPWRELIRCKDCERNPKNGVPRTICPCPMDRYMGDNGYCSKAERIEE